MNRLALALVALASTIVLAPHQARAQASVAATCGTQSIPTGFGNAYPVILQTGDLCVNASITPSGTQDVNVVEVGGHAVSTTVPVSGTVTAAQATASALNATVVGTGTFAVQNTAATPAGSNVIGHVITDATSVASVSPAARTIVPLDISTVTTGGTAVTALNSGHRTAGGWLLNPIGATINLCINEQSTASGTTSAGALTCIQPGQSYSLTPSAAAVSVITSDSSHPFSGMGLN